LVRRVVPITRSRIDRCRGEKSLRRIHPESLGRQSRAT
jgi:hypothetical protein